LHFASKRVHGLQLKIESSEGMDGRKMAEKMKSSAAGKRKFHR